MKAKLLFTALIFMLSVLAYGDISEYFTFSTGTETYTAITGTSIDSVVGDDMLSEAIDIGFTFAYGVDVFTQVKVSSNGWVGLGTTASHSNLSNQLNSTWCPVLAPIWDDTGYANVQYLTTGTAPNRVFTVQYTGLRWYYYEQNTHDLQVKIYETGMVKFVYGAESAAPSNPSASIGINISPGGATNFWSVTPGNPATASNTTENNTITTWPGNGTVYLFNPPIPVPNDIGALSITGNLTPSVGTSSNYTVNIRNYGLSAQSNYAVKIMSGTTELASVPGPAIAPSTNAAVVIPWTPTVAGAMAISGKVVLAGDENPVNDQSGPLNIIVQPEGTTVVTIGTGNELARMPLDMFYRNSLFETIYPAAEITAGGVITGIAFYNNFQTNLPGMPTKIWLGATAQNDLSAGWIPSTEMVQVFDGNVDYPAGSNVITIPFTIPFAYGGTNLAVMVNRPMDTTYYSSADQFQCQTVGTNRTRNVWSDMTNYDPANPPTQGITLTGQFPKTSLYFTPAGPNPVFGVSPAQYNLGTILMDHSVTRPFTVFNSGGGSLEISSISITGSPFFTLGNLPTFPVNLSTGQNFAFNFTYLPTAAGPHTATINITDNLTRTVHPVTVQATCMDPTIYTSPYAQNWDDVTAPDLPLDWQKLYISADQWGYIQTEDWQSHTTPNAVQIYNSQDTNSTMLLIAPPLAPTIPVNGSRIKFWARADNNYPVLLGVMSDPTDATTFTQIQSVELSPTWTEYVVGFQTYTGAGHNIAFKHANQAGWQSIYIDELIIEDIPDNDLAAIAISGNSTPSVGMQTVYSINVFNWGTVPQSDYTVKLYREGDIEIASIPGPLCNPGLSVNVQLTWAPATEGTTYIYGKVILTGDENNLNDQTPNLSVHVQPAGTLVVTIGDGSETARMPLDMYYMNSLFETIYYSTELNFLGMINGIVFYNTFATNLPAMPTNIWMGTTTQTDLSTAWIPSTQLTQVFSGNVDYPSGENAITINFPVPFLYLEGNLVMMVERPMDQQYYSFSDQFYCQTVGNNRTRNVWSDGDDYDPAAPPDFATPTGQFPKTSFLAIPGGVGHLTGNVYGAGNQPLNNATVQITGGAQANTNAQGHYLIQNLIADDYTVTCSRYGYISQTVNVTIPEDSTVVQNFTLQQMPTVTVTGTIVGSDAPTVGLAGASIALTGYENYQAIANAQGVFTITGVYANQTYQYIASALGYQVLTGSINVGSTNYNMNTVTLAEIAYTPRNVAATVVSNPAAVNVTWLAPDPSAVDVDQSFESATFPPTDWSRIVTNNGPPNTVGVYPTWYRVGTITSGTTVITPTDGAWQCGFWWDYNHQDEWLITPAFNCPQGAALIFDTYCFYGSMNDDHYYVKITNNNGTTWNVLWDATTLTGGWNSYTTPVQIDLGAYTGQQVKIAWHASDPPSNDGMWYNWFIDNIEVSNTTASMRFPTESLTLTSGSKNRETPQPAFTTQPLTKATDAVSLDYRGINREVSPNRPETHPTRSLQGYKIWRLIQGQEQNETTWTLLTPAMITALTYTDEATPSLPAGTYKWAVKAIYTNDVLSLAAFSNPITLGTQTVGTLTGVVRTSNNIPILGAVVTAGSFTATSNSSGVYSMLVAVGTYAVTCAATGYQTITHDNIVISENQTTIHNFIMTVGNEDEVIITRTELKGNYPNPFNPETTIAYDVKGAEPVRLEIYNTKGQLIRTLVNEMKANGHHTAVWNGRDNNGKAVASGIYHYRMQAGAYTANRRMMLLK